MTYLYVALGGALGSVARFALSGWIGTAGMGLASAIGADAEARSIIPG